MTIIEVVRRGGYSTPGFEGVAAIGGAGNGENVVGTTEGGYDLNDEKLRCTIRFEKVETLQQESIHRGVWLS
jgi:hypothetical protein